MGSGPVRYKKDGTPVYKPITPWKGSWAETLHRDRPVVGQSYEVRAVLACTTEPIRNAPVMTLEYAGNGMYTDGHSLYYGRKL